MVQILIIEDVLESREWLADIARRAFPDCEIVEASTLREGMEASGNRTFSLALIDLGLPDGSGIDLLRHLGASTPCVVTTVIRDDAHIVAALSAGAQGYLLKDQPVDVIVRQLSLLQEGLPALSPSIARRIMEHFRLTGPVSNCDGLLTNREKETLALIARGFRNTDAAKTLGISEVTVASHIKSIYRKLGISSRAEASWHATRLGL